MSEIDKLVNRAYPDELRRVSPIAVNEDAILARTLDKLGLEAAGPAKRQAKKKKGRYVGRHGAQREVHLVEVPLEPAPKHRWVGWIGWAAAACLLITCAVRFGPFLLSNILVDPHSAAGQAALDFHTEGAEDAADEAGVGGGLLEAATENTKSQAPASGRAVEDLLAGMDWAKAAGLQSYDGRISILRVSQIDENDQFTVVIHFPNMDQLTVAQYYIAVFGDGAYGQELNVLEVKRENEDGFAYLTYHLLQHNCGDTGMDQGTMQIFYSPAVYDNYAANDDEALLQDQEARSREKEDPVMYKLFLGSKVPSVSRRMSEQETEGYGFPFNDSDGNAAIEPDGTETAISPEPYGTE